MLPAYQVFDEMFEPNFELLGVKYRGSVLAQKFRGAKFSSSKFEEPFAPLNFRGSTRDALTYNEE